MTPADPRLIVWLKSLRGRRAVAAVLVSVVTLVLIGGVVLTTTTAGCGPAQQLGLKGLTTRCKLSPSAVVISPGPTPTGPTNSPSVATSPSPSGNPFPEPAPPPVTPPPATIPDSGPATGAYQPFTPPSSGPSDPNLPMNCRLPIFVGPSGSGGFIVFPGGTYVADPRSAVTIPSPTPAPSSPPPQVGGYPSKFAGLSYDRAFSKWVPVAYQFVSPDGSHYAWSSPDSIYVENVAGGASIELGEGHAWNIIGVQNAGLYATRLNEAGLWLLPYSGAAKQLTSTGYWQIASGSAAYGTATSAVPDGVANTILRLDLQGGAVVDWFTRGGGSSSVIGFDASGNAVISVNYFTIGGYDVWLATGPKTRVPLFGSAQGLSLLGPVVADSHGIWIPLSFSGYNFGSNVNRQGVGLYAPGSGLWWMSNIGAQIGGGCS